MDRLTDHVIVLSALGPRVFRPHHDVRPGAFLELNKQRERIAAGEMDPAELADLSREQLAELLAGPTAETQFVAEAQEARGDVHHLGADRYLEVPFACSCGAPLDADWQAARRAWAEHSAKVAGVDLQLLAGHAVLRIADLQGTVVVECECGAAFSAAEDDPTDPGVPLGLWEDHVSQRKPRSRRRRAA